MVSKPIPDPDVRVCFLWPRNPMGHNEDFVSAWGEGGGGGGGGGGVCHVPHWI